MSRVDFKVEITLVLYHIQYSLFFDLSKKNNNNFFEVNWPNILMKGNISNTQIKRINFSSDVSLDYTNTLISKNNYSKRVDFDRAKIIILYKTLAKPK